MTTTTPTNRQLVFDTFNKAQDIMIDKVMVNIEKTTPEGHYEVLNAYNKITAITSEYFANTRPITSPPWRVVSRPTMVQRIINFFRRA